MDRDHSSHFTTDSGVSPERYSAPVLGQSMPEVDEIVCPDESPLTHNMSDVDSPSTGRVDDDMDLARYADHSNLLRSFDMIFQLHQRSEEIRARLEKIDRILLSSRTVAGLTRLIVATLEKELALAAVRILYRQGHPTALLLGWEPPPGVGVLPDNFFENEGLFHSEPFLLDDPSGPLARSLFGVAAPLISSAAVATLAVDQQDVGIICFGSDDPTRYCGSMNTDLIASLAHKISLGIQNASDHERRAREALKGAVDGIYSNVFFREVVQREFDRAWRYGTPFSLMALSWKCHAGEDLHPTIEVLGLVRRKLRACDLVAHDDGDTVWVLLPETDAAAARVAAQRLVAMAAESFFGEITFHAGITEFSRTAPVVSRLVNKARVAMEEAMESVNSRIVVKTPRLPDAFSETSSPLSSAPA